MLPLAGLFVIQESCTKKLKVRVSSASSLGTGKRIIGSLVVDEHNLTEGHCSQMLHE
jgi:hypothetical protein